MARTLRSIGFEVLEHIDVNQKGMKKALKGFGKKLETAGKGAVGLFYYAGHGVQVNGTNYMIPVNVDIQDETDVDIEAVSANTVLEKMAFAGNGLNFVVLDACRNNPFKRSFRAVTRGLARMDASKGTLIAYATSPGDIAADGKGNNSPYTIALSRAMQTPGITVERLFKEVRNMVIESTNSAQVPWESSSLTGGDFFFKGGGKAEQSSVVIAPIDQTIDKEAMLWESVKDSTDVSMFKSYLEQYPNGVFAVPARMKLKILEPEVAVISTRALQFKAGSHKPKVLSARGECKKVKLGPVKLVGKALVGGWTHPRSSGKVKYYIEDEAIRFRLTGRHIYSSREQVEIKGASLSVAVFLKHEQGSCRISFRLPNVLKN